MMKYTENALNVLTAKSYRGIGNAWIVRNLSHNEDVETIVSRLNQKNDQEPTSVEAFMELRQKYESTILNKLHGFCDGFVALGDKDFPKHRGRVSDGKRPVFLYYKGDIKLLDTANTNISVIGLLNPSEQVESRERQLVSQLVKSGATIVSGLALGCDSIAHEEALASGGKTIAILPSPLTDILPTSNKSLASQIVEKGGLLVTEYGNGFRSKMELNTRYFERDRLQAMFCDAIVLAASYSRDSSDLWRDLADQKLDSGARLAMGFAKDFHIPRSVMYDRVRDAEDPMYDLSREIIQESPSIMVITPDNIADSAKQLTSIGETAGKPLRAPGLPFEDS